MHSSNSRPNILAALLAVVMLCFLENAPPLLAQAPTSPPNADPLPSWNEGATKKTITDFVAKVTKEGAPDFVPIAERIATFDNDGTLWCEQPMPVQLYFAIDRVNALAPKHPEWKDKQPFKGIIENDLKSALAGGEKTLLEIIAVTHAGMTTEEFEVIVKDWIATAKNPKFNRPFTECIYQPMVELLAYLRANGFKTFIVSGGGIEFMRPWAEKTYGIPPEQVIGSSGKTKFELRNGVPVLVKLAELNFNDDKEGKPIAINHHIGRRPIAAFGNSDGDLQMLQWTTAGKGPRFGLIVHHTDAEREVAYDRASHIGKLDKALDESKERGWTVVDMKKDWKQIFPINIKAVTAIDILLEPDAVMLKHAEVVNARLLKEYPKRFALDSMHRPHITLTQRFVNTADLDKVYEAMGKVFAKTNLKAMKLSAFKYYYVPGGDVGVAGICAKPTPEIIKLQAEINAAIKPFTVETGSIGAFTAPHDDTASDAALIKYVSSFVPAYSGENFNPHVSVGVAPREYLDKMITESFESFSFSPASAAIYQLGPFGTAAKKLKGWELK